MKVAILMDALLNKGGAERIVWMLACELHADIYAGIYTSETTFDAFKQCRVTTLIPGARTTLSFLKLRRAFRRLHIPDYDVYISFGGSSLEAAHKHHPMIWYCSAPVRWMYDLYPEECAKRTGFNSIIFRAIAGITRYFDQRAVKKIHTIITNSQNVRQRINKFYPGRDATVICPPIATDRFQWKSQETFYLSTARLDPIKRVDLAVQAFLLLPDKKLIIASTGPDEARLKKIAAHAPNIIFLGSVTEQELAQLYGRCIATLSLSHQEDFGMVPLEGMAAGKPCIASNEGGHLETILPGKTGVLVDVQNIDALRKTITWLTPARANTMRAACETHARTFDTKVFMTRMKEAITQCTSSS